MERRSGIGVLAGIEAAFRRAHEIHQPADDLARRGEVGRIAADLPGQHIAAQGVALDVQKLLVVRARPVELVGYWNMPPHTGSISRRAPARVLPAMARQVWGSALRCRSRPRSNAHSSVSPWMKRWVSPNPPLTLS